MEEIKLALTRRQTLLMLGAQLVGSPACIATPQDRDRIDKQPYFANITRAIAVLDKLGAPMAALDSQQIAALEASDNDNSIAAAESILAKCTLADVSIEADGSVRVMPGGSRNELVEQGWRVFLVRIANRSTAARNVVFTTGTGWNEFGGGPGRMSPGHDFRAERPSLMDTLNKAPLIKEMWLTS